MRQKGLQTHRFKNNPEERRFAKNWEEWNAPTGSAPPYILVDELLGGPLRPQAPRQGPQEPHRERHGRTQMDRVWQALQAWGRQVRVKAPKCSSILDEKRS